MSSHAPTFLPPLSTPADLTKSERVVLRVAHTFVREDAIGVCDLKPDTYDRYLNLIRIKHREAVRLQALDQFTAPIAVHGGYCNRG